MPKTLKPERQWPRPNLWQKTWSKSNFQQKKNSFGFRDAILDNGCLASARRIATHPKEWDMKPQQAKPQQAKRSQLSQPPLTPSQSREVIAFIIGVLRLTDNAANNVIAFFQTLGLSGPIGLPREFMLELGALLQFREWHQAGVIPWNDADGLTIDDLITDAVDRFDDDPGAVQLEGRGTQSMIDMLRRWNETFAPLSRQYLDGDIAIHWDRQFDIELAVQSFADFLCRHRRVGQQQEDAQ